MISDLLEENQDLRKQVAELEKENAELKEKNEGYCRSRDRLISIGFPTFKDCKEYAEHLTKAKELLERLLITSCNSDVLNLLPNRSEVLRVRVEAEQFLKDTEEVRI